VWARYASDFHTEIPELATIGFLQNHVDSSTEMGDFVGFHFGSDVELGASTLISAKTKCRSDLSMAS
jgi:hypothetical protein